MKYSKKSFLHDKPTELANIKSKRLFGDYLNSDSVNINHKNFDLLSELFRLTTWSSHKSVKFCAVSKKH